jgi:hypothetical protein
MARRIHVGREPRTASRTATGSSSRRASTERSAASDAASSHWTSSIARQIGASAASIRNAVRNAAATARSSAFVSESPSSSAASSARCWIGGNSGRTSPATVPSRSVSAMNDDRVSASDGRAARIRYSRPTAASMPDSQSVVLPVPASPVSTAAPGRRSRASRSRTMASSSSSLPTRCSTVTRTPSTFCAAGSRSDNRDELVATVRQRLECSKFEPVAHRPCLDRQRCLSVEADGARARPLARQFGA